MEMQLAPVRKVKAWKDGRFYCPFEKCSASSFLKKGLVAHYKTAHLGVKYSCSKCGEQLTTSYSLHKHDIKCRGNKDLQPVRRVTASRNGRFHCPYQTCSFSSIQKSGLVAHYKVEHLGVRYPCSKCDLQLKSSYSLSLHKLNCKGTMERALKPARQVIASRDGRYYCPYKKCAHSSSQNGGLTIHYKVQHLGFRYRCPRCDREFMYPHGLRHHKTTCMSRSEKDLTSVLHVKPGKDGLCYCPHEGCLFSCALRSDLIVHNNQEHLGVKYKCSKCNSYFKYSSSLSSHETICKGKGVQNSNPAQDVTPHLDGRWYCPMENCSISFTKKNSLLRHYQVEHLQVRYPCLKCGQQFRGLHGLRIHKMVCKDLNPARQVTAARDGRFYCPHKTCSFSCTDKNRLVVHYKVKHVGERFPCSECGCQLKSLKYLRWHKKCCKGGAERELKPVRDVPPGKDGRYHCMVKNCFHSSTQRGALVVHYKKEHLGVRYPCLKCGVELKTAYSLHIHKTHCKGAIERDLKPVRQVMPGRDGRFHCPSSHCSHSSSMKNSLVAHYKIKHLGVRYPCQNCNAQFHNVSHLNKHRCTGKIETIRKPAKHEIGDRDILKTFDKVSPDKNGRFYCPYESCRSSYNSNRTLEIHCKIIHQGLKFSCPRCPLQFTQKVTLTKHLLTCNGGYRIISNCDTENPSHESVDEPHEDSSPEDVEKVSIEKDSHYFPSQE